MTVLNGMPMYGYGIMATIHKEFGVLLSPGTLYPLLHSLEGSGLIESNHDMGRVIYQISPEGKQKLKHTLTNFNLAVEKISVFVRAQCEEMVLPVPS